MRILHVAPYYAPAYVYGGPVRSLEGLVLALQSLGVEQRVITTSSDGPNTLDAPRGWTRRDGVPIQYLPRWVVPYIAPGVLPAAVEWSKWADLVHVMGVFYVPSVLGLLAARSSHKPIVLSTRGALQPVAMATRQERKRAWLRMFRHVYEDVDAFHATAPHEAEAIASAFGADRHLAVIPNGTELISNDEVCALRERNPSDPLLVGMLGRLHPIKAVDRVLDALAILHRRGIAARLEFAGPIQDREYRDALVRQASRLGLSGHFELIGARLGAEQLRFYARCSVLVVASHSENFSNVVVEALNVETPVVASLGTPWAELAEVGCGAWVANQPESLADAIAPFLTTPELRQKAGIAGRRLVQREYTWPMVARRMVAAYDEAIRRHRDR